MKTILLHPALLFTLPNPSPPTHQTSTATSGLSTKQFPLFTLGKFIYATNGSLPDTVA